MIQIFIDKPSEKKLSQTCTFWFWSHKNSNNQFQWFLNFATNYLFFPSSCNYQFWRKGKFSRRAAILVVIFARLLIYGFWCVRKKYHQRHEIQKLFSLLRKIIFTFFEKSVERIFNLVQTLTFSHSWYQNVWWLLDYEKNCFCGSTNLIDFVNLVYPFIYVP